MPEEAKKQFKRDWLKFLSHEEFQMLSVILLIFTALHLAGLVDYDIYKEVARISLIFAFGDNAVSSIKG